MSLTDLSKMILGVDECSCASVLPNEAAESWCHLG